MNRSFFLAASVCCVLFVTILPSIRAATLTVTNTNDTGAGSLRDALAGAADADTIDLSIAGTILLTNGELVVTNNINIVGPGPTALLIDGNGTNRVFHIGPSNVVSISSLTITNGFVSGASFSDRIGAGIYNDHTTLTVSNCILSGNSADFGGGIYSDGLGGSATLLVVNCTLISNSVPVFQGGGIYNNGSSGGNATLIVANSTLIGNVAGDGGGIFNDGENGSATLLIVSTILNSNSVSSGGGGIYNKGDNGGSGRLTISNSIVSGNSAAFGGGIFITGSDGTATVQVVNSTLSSNSASFFSSGFGGGIYSSDAALTVANSVLSDNAADGIGGALYSDCPSGSATVQILSSTLSINSANKGGGVYNEAFEGNATLTISNSSLNGNFAGSGGGIFVSGFDGTATVQIASSILSSNSANSSGGGIYVGSATLTIANSTLSGNSADTAGGIYNDGQSSSGTVTLTNSILSGNAANETGGGIYNNGENGGSATVILTRSTLGGNSAVSGAGIFNDGFEGSATLQVTSSTLSSNLVADAGGAIYNDAGRGFASVAITNSTLSDNLASNSGGAIYINGTLDGTATVQVAYSTLSSNSATDGGGFFNLEGALEIGDTILNAGSGLNITNSDGTVLSHGHNLSSDAAGGNGTNAPGGYLNATGDIRNTNPRLGPLQDNGGPTFTHALLTNSPAINAGSDINSPGTDQRGVARPQGAHSDIGAFELEDTPPVAACRNVTVTLVSGCTTNVSVDNGSSDPDLGSTITLSQSPAGPYSAGTNIVTLTVTDNLGATNSCTATVIVIDTIAPTITCPSNKTAQATSPAGAVVSFADPAASDNCSATVSCVPPSGSTFPIGDTVVHCTARDASGNTASCTFTMHVKNTSEQLVDTEQVILGLGIDAKVKKSVLKKFQKIEKQINTDHTRNACKQLQNLLRKVQQDLFKERLTNDQAIQITTPLVQALTVLGCP